MKSAGYRGAAPPRPLEAWDGVLPVDKERGPTSHDIVERVRRRFGIRKAGHGGTLDPQATGLLVLLLGRGTKLAGLFLSSDKQYEGTMRLGAATDTQDGEGQIISEGDWSAVTRAQVEAEMGKRSGDLLQTPPMVSAAKVDGVPLYKRARRGEVVERAPKLVHVYSFQLLDFSPPRVAFRLACTKGTYVRTLCADIGAALGCGAYLESLRRTRSGRIEVARAVPGPDLLRLSASELTPWIIPMEKATALCASGPRSTEGR